MLQTVSSAKIDIPNTLFEKDWPTDCDLIVNAIGAKPQVVALSRLQTMVENVAAWLLERGLKRGDRVGILALNCLEYILLDLAALRLGIVTAAFDPVAFSDRSDLVTNYDLAVLFVGKGHAGREAEPNRVLPIEQVPKLDERNRQTELPSFRAYAPSDVCTIKFTSGSTGQAKGLGATTGSINQSIQATQALFAHGGSDRLLVVLPLSLLQQRYWIYSAIVFEHDVIVTDSRLVIETIQTYKPTVIMGIPALFDTLKEYVELSCSGDGTDASLRETARDFFGPDIRYLWTGSAAARPDTLQFFEETCGVPIFEGYGLNETCIVTKNHPGAHKRGSVGKPLDGVKVTVSPDGIIHVRREHPVNTRYLYAAPGASEKIFQEDGSVITGDLGHLDDDGYLYIKGRADDLIVLTNGKTLTVRSIEETLLRLPEVRQAMVIGTGFPALGALVCPAPGHEPAQVKAAIRQATRDLKPEPLALTIIVEDGFTMEAGLLTSQGKLKRSAILKHYADDITQAYEQF
ncbi:AMP-binding protein [Breoghania sp.]|uniref:AMP-binding protein n=1 Tax=Breoghania sp. TaxID=2065378 RepID=UPI002AABF225|nr:AMP-binding protein [Breoghania sp.]